MGGKRITIEYIARCMDKENYKLLSIVYENNKQKLDVVCDKNHSYQTSWNNWTNGRRCPYCNGNESTRMTIDKISQEMNKENYKLLSKEYKNNKSKLEIKCLRNHIFETTWDYWKTGNRCPHCSGNIKYTYEQVKDIIKKYKNSNEKLEVMCPKGHIYKTALSNYLRGRRCPACNNEIKANRLKDISKKRMHNYEFIKNEIEKDGSILLADKYKGNKIPMPIKCPKGHMHNASWGSYLQGSRCPQCNESKGEKFISKYLNDNNIKYKSQYKFEDCKYKLKLPFDFYLLDYNIAIEYDGEQHYKPIDFAGKGEKWSVNNMLETQHRDSIKTKYCLDNNIKLIRIPYWDFDNIEEILNSLF